MHCYWPIIGASQKAIKHTKPDPSIWELYPVKILSQAGINCGHKKNCGLFNLVISTFKIV